MKTIKSILISTVWLILWVFVYILLQDISDWFVFKLLKLEKGRETYGCYRILCI